MEVLAISIMIGMLGLVFHERAVTAEANKMRRAEKKREKAEIAEIMKRNNMIITEKLMKEGFWG